MSFEIDPVFYTETFVKILQGQGHTYHAYRLCEKILSQDESNPRIRELLEKLKPTFKFEKKNLTVQEETTEPGMAPTELVVAEDSPGISRPPYQNAEKISKLEALLVKIQSRAISPKPYA